MKNIKYQSKGSTPQSVGTFSEAFRQAKNSGVKTFMWKGKKYGTDKKGEGGVHSQFDEKGFKAMKARKLEDKWAKHAKARGEQEEKDKRDAVDKYFAKKGTSLKTGDASAAEAMAKADRDKKIFRFSKR